MDYLWCVVLMVTCCSVEGINMCHICECSSNMDYADCTGRDLLVIPSITNTGLRPDCIVNVRNNPMLLSIAAINWEITNRGRFGIVLRDEPSEQTDQPSDDVTMPRSDYMTSDLAIPSAKRNALQGVDDDADKGDNGDDDGNSIEYIIGSAVVWLLGSGGSVVSFIFMYRRANTIRGRLQTLERAWVYIWTEFGRIRRLTLTVERTNTATDTESATPDAIAPSVTTTLTTTPTDAADSSSGTLAILNPPLPPIRPPRRNRRQNPANELSEMLRTTEIQHRQWNYEIENHQTEQAFQQEEEEEAGRIRRDSPIVPPTQASPIPVITSTPRFRMRGLPIPTIITNRGRYEEFIHPYYH